MNKEPVPPISEQIGIIRAEEWQPHASALKHVFLVGNLQVPVPHAFFRRIDVEVIACVYEPGDDGLPHWHAEVDEIEMVLEGRISYLDITSGSTLCFEPGDLLNIERGVCVQRLVREPARTLAIKLPSHSGKVHCNGCSRECAYRREPFSST